jgi:hypothetical protein
VNPNVCPVSPPPACAPPQPICATAYAAGIRFFQLADELRNNGVDEIVEGSVCEAFGPILAAIADLVKAPSALRLPSQPASSEVVVVRILAADGSQRKVCTQAANDAARTTSGWWFMDCSDRADPPSVAAGPTKCIYLDLNAADPANGCAASPGETYSAEYLGQVPAGGCPSPSADTGVAHSSSECAAALGGKAADWWCYGSGATGTCLCNRSAP